MPFCNLFMERPSYNTTAITSQMISWKDRHLQNYIFMGDRPNSFGQNPLGHNRLGLSPYVITPRS